MCWSEQVSWISFVVGTLINAWVAWNTKSSVVRSLCGLWQWVLFVQVAEAYIWRGNNTGNEEMARVASSMQYLLIITQPLILGMLLVAVGSNSENSVLTTGLLIAYLVWVLWSIWSVPMPTTKPGCANNHLEMTWWKSLPGGVWPYLVMIALVVLLLLRPMEKAWWALLFVFGTLGLSALLYSCGTGSMWCWFAVAAPLFTWWLYSS